VTTESSVNTCGITNKQRDTKSNHVPNPSPKPNHNPNPITKQHSLISIQLM